MPTHLKKALRSWSREDLNVRVFQGVRAGGPRALQVCCRETFDMESGGMLAREYFDPGKGQSRLPTPALPDCLPASARTLSVRSVFWYSEVEPRCRARACASHGGLLPLVVVRGEDVSAHAHDAPLPENGGVTESGGEVTASEQSLDHVSRKGQGQIP